MSRTRRSLLALLTIAAMALTACNDTAAPDPGPGPDGGVGGRKAAATLDWNRIALGMIEKYKPNQQGALRGMAYLTLAQFAAADRAGNQWPKPSVTQGAIAGASAVVLTYLYPAEAATIEAEVRGRETALDPGKKDGFRDGEIIGRAIGERAVARARQDRFDAQWTGTVPTGAGIWFSSTVPAAPPVLPLLGQMKPFFMSAGDQFRPAPPPTFGSTGFLDGLAEVRRISDSRTAQQDSIAKFWAMGTGTLIAGFWNTTAATLIERHRLDDRAAAHALALMNTVAMDGLIACADAKFAYWSCARARRTRVSGWPSVCRTFLPTRPTTRASPGRRRMHWGPCSPASGSGSTGWRTTRGSHASSAASTFASIRTSGSASRATSSRLAIDADEHDWLLQLLQIG